MVNITGKQCTLRKAVATAVVKVSATQTTDAVKQHKVPKGDVLEFGRAAGLLAIKKTSDVIPDCHPLPVEFAAITYSVEEMAIHIFVEVHTIYKTGVEVEAMHGASVVALVIYDMLKPIDAHIEISAIKLVSKSGGKTSFKRSSSSKVTSAVVVCSDRVSKDEKQDTSGKAIINKLHDFGIVNMHYEVVPDDVKAIQDIAGKLVEAKVNLIIFTGGTGVSPRDVTPEALLPLIEKDIPGIMEQARSYGNQRMPYAFLSRGVAGFIKDTLVITTPGSESGAIETIDAVFPYVLHALEVKKNVPH